MLTKFKMLFLFVFNFDLFKFSAAILEKGLFWDLLGFSQFTETSADVVVGDRGYFVESSNDAR